MNILYLGYWGAQEGLSVATIYPHLNILAELEVVSNIYYFSIERHVKKVSIQFECQKIKHIPLYSSPSLLSKFKDFTAFPKTIIAFIKKYQIKKIICRGAPAGALGYLVWKKMKIPYIVESFEPHADYMRESKVWKKYDLRYILEIHWENMQKKTAEFIIPVAKKYGQKLINQEGISKKRIMVMPCCVPIKEFAFNIEDRGSVRKKLAIKDRLTGIYVGKFGGIYFDDKAFDLFKAFFNKYRNSFF